VEILSTGGTARLLTEHDMPVTEVSDYTGFPEMMGGRVKTLHPRIHGGILGRRGVDDAVMRENEIRPIDLVVVNLYPFERDRGQPRLHPGGRHREHRHRRAHPAAGRGQEPRRSPRCWWTRRTIPGCWPRWPSNGGVTTRPASTWR
jgi:hypothetical protein